MASPDAAPLRVVIVDDAADLRSLMRAQLGAAGGFDVVAEGCDGMEAVALAATFRPDLMVLDLAMPRMDGLQALPELRRVSPESAVVMLTGFDDTVAGAAVDAGAAGFLTKGNGLADLPGYLKRLAARADDEPAAAAPPSRRAGRSAARPTAGAAPATPDAIAPPIRPTAAPALAADAACVATALLALATCAIGRSVGPALAATAALLVALPCALGLCRRPVTAAVAGSALGASALLAVQRWSAATPAALDLLDAGVVIVATLAANVAYRRHAARVAAAATSAGSVLALGRTLARNVEELHAANASLEAANADLRQFGFVVSHDLGEPLRTMAGFSRLLKGRTAGPQAEAWLDAIDAAATRMQRLIDDLRSYTMAGQAELAHERVDLREVLTDVTANLAAAVTEAGATVQAGPLPVVAGDRSMLTLVLQNLVANAVKFSDGPPTVTLDATLVEGSWRITVTDDGIGIDPERVDKAFALFGRLQSREAYPGTGLGLAICKRIVERHGGTVTIGPRTDGPGTTVTLRLPAA